MTDFRFRVQRSRREGIKECPAIAPNDLWVLVVELIPVLIVEDEALILTLAEETLKEAGYAVSLASSGSEAKRMLDSKDAAFRALITDIDLQDQILGWELARRAREKDPTMAIVFVTGGGTNEWASRGVPNSVLLTKPFAPAQLVTAVSQLLNRTPPIVE